MSENIDFVPVPRWRNWGRNFQCRPDRLYRPGSIEEIASVVRLAREQGRRIRPVGSGYSYTRLVQTDEVMLSLERWTGVESADRDSGLAVVRAGTEIRALMRELAPMGLALENIGDIDRQTLAGAIATNTHGTGIRLGGISTRIAALELMTAAGELVCIPADESDLFRAAAVSLGALGIITRITMRVEPMYWLAIERRKTSLDTALKQLDHNVRENRNYEFFWFPQSPIIYSKTMNPTSPGRSGGRTIGRAINDLVNENAALWVFCEACRIAPLSRNKLLEIGSRFVPQDSSVQRADAAYATERLVRHQEMEYAVPAHRAGEALAEIDHRLRRFPTRTVFPLEVRFTRRDDLLMSPANACDVAFIAVHTYWKEDHHEYFEACEEILLNAGGRPHWGKLHTLNSRQLRSLYPGWESFSAIRRKLDPESLFQNVYLRRILE